MARWELGRDATRSYGMNAFPCSMPHDLQRSARRSISPDPSSDARLHFFPARIAAFIPPLIDSPQTTGEVISLAAMKAVVPRSAPILPLHAVRNRIRWAAYFFQRPSTPSGE